MNSFAQRVCLLGALLLAATPLAATEEAPDAEFLSDLAARAEQLPHDATLEACQALAAPLAGKRVVCEDIVETLVVADAEGTPAFLFAYRTTPSPQKDKDRFFLGNVLPLLLPCHTPALRDLAARWPYSIHVKRLSARFTGELSSGGFHLTDGDITFEAPLPPLIDPESATGETLMARDSLPKLNRYACTKAVERLAGKRLTFTEGRCFGEGEALPDGRKVYRATIARTEGPLHHRELWTLHLEFCLKDPAAAAALEDPSHFVPLRSLSGTLHLRPPKILPRRRPDFDNWDVYPEPRLLLMDAEVEVGEPSPRRTSQRTPAVTP